MPRTSRYPDLDRMLNGRLLPILQSYRDAGLTWFQIANAMRDTHDLTADLDSWRRWFREMGGVDR